jgi:hypothetical protein
MDGFDREHDIPAAIEEYLSANDNAFTTERLKRGKRGAGEVPVPTNESAGLFHSEPPFAEAKPGGWGWSAG